MLVVVVVVVAVAEVGYSAYRVVRGLVARLAALVPPAEIDADAGKDEYGENAHGKRSNLRGGGWRRLGGRWHACGCASA